MEIFCFEIFCFSQQRFYFRILRNAFLPSSKESFFLFFFLLILPRDDQIIGRHHEQAKDGGGHKAADNNESHTGHHLVVGKPAQRHHGEDGRQGRHQDRAQADLACLDQGVLEGHVFFLLVDRIDKKDTVIDGNTHEHEKAHHGDHVHTASCQEEKQEGTNQREGNTGHDHQGKPRRFKLHRHDQEYQEDTRQDRVEDRGEVFILHIFHHGAGQGYALREFHLCSGPVNSPCDRSLASFRRRGGNRVLDLAAALLDHLQLLAVLHGRDIL